MCRGQKVRLLCNCAPGSGYRPCGPVHTVAGDCSPRRPRALGQHAWQARRRRRSWNPTCLAQPRACASVLTLLNICKPQEEVGRAPPTFFGTDEKMAILPSAISECPVFAIAARLRVLTHVQYPFCLSQWACSTAWPWSAASSRPGTADYDTRRYLINASLIVCGIFTLIQSYGVKHPKLPFQLGAGVCSVMVRTRYGSRGTPSRV